MMGNLVAFFYLQAAAAMCVAMGSFSDPAEAQGLAHFLGLIKFVPCL
jgi:secreted Zn-dependent insulinase-like peptidase